MTSLWDIQGNDLDRAYFNIRLARHPIEQALRLSFDEMWKVYEPYADRDFRQAFARDIDARHWEMYLGYRLLQSGKALVPVSQRHRKGGQPDICIQEGSDSIWIEAIAPTKGDAGPDEVRGPIKDADGIGVGMAPKRQALLRITSALWTKHKFIERYLKSGVIGPNDVRLIAIGAGRFGVYASDDPLPLILSAIFPIGNQYFSIDVNTFELIKTGFAHSAEIPRKGGIVPRDAFLTSEFAPISGVIWSRASIGNMSSEVRPLTLVHNPMATIPMNKLWGVWDREFVATHKGDEEWTARDILKLDEE